MYYLLKKILGHFSFRFRSKIVRSPNFVFGICFSLKNIFDLTLVVFIYFKAKFITEKHIMLKSLHINDIEFNIKHKWYL